VCRSPSLLLAAELDVPREEARCYVANPHLRQGCRLPLPVMSLEKATRNMTKQEFIVCVQVYTYIHAYILPLLLMSLSKATHDMSKLEFIPILYMKARMSHDQVEFSSATLSNMCVCAWLLYITPRIAVTSGKKSHIATLMCVCDTYLDYVTCSTHNQITLGSKPKSHLGANPQLLHRFMHRYTPYITLHITKYHRR
jgi:hypothetical protein